MERNPEQMSSEEPKPKRQRVGAKTRPVGPKRKDAQVEPDQDLPGLTRYQKYAETPTSRVACWELVPDPANPRQIDPVARAKLLDEVRRGLVSRPTHNRTTGELVGGHQRISALFELEGPCPDCQGQEARLSPLWRAIRSGKPHSLERWLPPEAPTENPQACRTCRGCGYKPFSLDLDRIEVSRAEQSRLNIVLNNRALMGNYDGQKLSELLGALQSEGISYDQTGFDPVDLKLYQVDPSLYLKTEEDPEAVRPIVADAQQIAELKKLRREHRDQSRQEGLAAASRVLMVRFETEEDRIAILQRLGKRPDDPTGATIEGWRLMVALGLRSDWP